MFFLLIFTTGNALRKLEAAEPPPVQIKLEVKHFVMPEKGMTNAALKPFTGKMFPATNTWWLDDSFKAGFPTNKNVTVEGLFQPSHVRVISAEQFKTLMRDWDQMDGVDYAAMPRVMTSSQRVAEIGMGYDLAKGVGWWRGDDDVKKRLEDWGIGAGLTPSLRVRPQLQADGKSMRVDWVADIVQIINFESYSASIASFTLPDAPVPDYRVRQMTGSHLLKEGESLVIGCEPVETKTKKSFVESGQTVRRVSIILLTPTLVSDSPGIPVKKRIEKGQP